jgi:hypothetical protein
LLLQLEFNDIFNEKEFYCVTKGYSMISVITSYVKFFFFSVLALISNAVLLFFILASLTPSDVYNRDVKIVSAIIVINFIILLFALTKKNEFVVYSYQRVPLIGAFLFTSFTFIGTPGLRQARSMSKIRRCVVICEQISEQLKNYQNRTGSTLTLNAANQSETLKTLGLSEDALNEAAAHSFFSDSQFNVRCNTCVQHLKSRREQ